MAARGRRIPIAVFRRRFEAAAAKYRLAADEYVSALEMDITAAARPRPTLSARRAVQIGLELGLPPGDVQRHLTELDVAILRAHAIVAARRSPIAAGALTKDEARGIEKKRPRKRR